MRIAVRRRAGLRTVPRTTRVVNSLSTRDTRNKITKRSLSSSFPVTAAAASFPVIDTIPLGGEGGDLTLDCGGVIDEKSLHARVAIWGKPGGDNAKPTLLICPSLSQNMLVADDRKTGRRGWWRHVVNYGENVLCVVICRVDGLARNTTWFRSYFSTNAERGRTERKIASSFLSTPPGACFVSIECMSTIVNLVCCSFL